MTLVLIASQPNGTIQNSAGDARVGPATFLDQDGNPATHYLDADGNGASTGAISADSLGRIMRYIESGIYTQVVGDIELEFHATPGSVGGKVDQLGVNVEARPYGASPSETGANNHQAISDAITAAGILGTHVLFPTKNATYAIDAVIINPGVKMVGDNVTLDGSSIAAAVAGSTQFGMKIQGSLSGSALASTGALTANSPTCAFPTATLAAGDYLLIQSSTQLYMDSVTVGTEKREEIRQIKTVDSGSSLTLTEGLRFSYSSGATTTATKVNMVDRPHIEGINILMGGTGKVHNGILLTYCRDPILERVRVDGCEDCAVQVVSCWGGRIRDCDIKNCTSPNPVVTTTGYGVVATHATRALKVTKNRFRNCRHAVAGGSCAAGVKVTDNDCENNGIGSGATLDCHEPCFEWEFDDNHIQGALNVGIIVRGHGTKVRRNVIRGGASQGILVKNFDGNPVGLRDTDIVDNDIEGCASYGIRFEGQSISGGDTIDCRIVNVRCSGNRVKNTGLGNIITILTDSLQISDNDLDAPTGTGNDGNNIRIYGTSATERCTNVTISGGHFRGATRQWLRAEFTDELTVCGEPNIAVNVANTILTTCTNAHVGKLVGAAAPAHREVHATNASFTLSLLVTAPTVIQTGSVSTSDKNATLATTNLTENAEFLIVRQDAGGFNLLVLNGTAGPTIYTLPAHAWVRVGRDATNANWIVLSAGTGT